MLYEERKLNSWYKVEKRAKWSIIEQEVEQAESEINDKKNQTFTQISTG